MKNWAYGFALNHEGANVGTIYYAAKYFEKEGIINPATVKPYTKEEIDQIKETSNENYMNKVPENAVIGMNVLHTYKVYWYDEDNSDVIIKSAAPLLLDAANGDMKDSNGNIVAKAM